LKDRQVKAISLWSTYGKMADWKCLDRIHLNVEPQLEAVGVSIQAKPQIASKVSFSAQEASRVSFSPQNARKVSFSAADTYEPSSEVDKYGKIIPSVISSHSLSDRRLTFSRRITYQKNGWNAFSVMSKDGKKTLDVAELYSFLTHNGILVSFDVVSLLRAADVGNHGTLTMERIH